MLVIETKYTRRWQIWFIRNVVKIMLLKVKKPHRKQRKLNWTLMSYYIIRVLYYYLPYRMTFFKYHAIEYSKTFHNYIKLENPSLLYNFILITCLSTSIRFFIFLVATRMSTFYYINIIYRVLHYKNDCLVNITTKWNKYLQLFTNCCKVW